MSTRENIYWVFSSAAQTVAALVAFLLAGYALVHSMMEAAARSDETLNEIHEALKQRYHKQLSALAIITAASIVSCLIVVYFNAHPIPWLWGMIALAAVLTLASIVGGVLFVITVVDPRKYTKAAQRLAGEVRPQAGAPEMAKSADFFTRFVALERNVRDLWEKRADGERLRRRQGTPSFREMLETLVIVEALPQELYERLLTISRYRNLVFHGHLTEVDPRILRELEAAQSEFARLTNAT